MTREKTFLAALCCIVLVLCCTCGRSNNLLLGEVRATAGTHPIVVTDCYRLHVNPPRSTADGFRYTPCRDADVVIRNEEAFVNGRTYGHLRPADAILVDHGVVSIQPGQAYK